MNIILFCSFLFTSSAEGTEIDASLDQVGLVKRWGYPVEKHEVTTQDGYILDLVRIPRGRMDNRNVSRPVMLLMHGMVESGTQWILNLPDQSAGFVFADGGLDVFLANVRGSTYGRKHRTLDPDNGTEFWNFSFDEMARYDLPAIIDKALAISGQEKLYYMGHSQGTLIAFILLSDQPRYNDKIKTTFMLSPVGTTNHVRGMLRGVLSAVSALWPVADMWRLSMGSQEVLSHTQAPGSGIVSQFLPIQDITYLFSGPPDFKHFNKSRKAVYAGHRPAGTSTRNLLHFGQMSSRGAVARYDYDNPVENWLHYGQSEPPVYNYTAIAAPMYLFWSRNDWMTTPVDIQTDLLPNLSKGVVKETFEIPEYNHADFIFATSAADRVYTPVLNLIRKDEETMRSAHFYQT